jgi:hypothetical protein
LGVDVVLSMIYEYLLVLIEFRDTRPEVSIALYFSTHGQFVCLQISKYIFTLLHLLKIARMHQKDGERREGRRLFLSNSLDPTVW